MKELEISVDRLKDSAKRGLPVNDKGLQLIKLWDMQFNTPKHETFGFTLEDIISVKTALTEIGVSVPETNDLSNIQVINLFRLLALQASKRIYE